MCIIDDRNYPNVFSNSVTAEILVCLIYSVASEVLSVSLDLQQIDLTGRIFFSIAKERKSFSLQKTVRKPQFNERPKHTDVNEGDEALFTVRVSGEPDVVWYQDDKLLEDDARIAMESENDVYRLCIKDARSEDAGRYKCVAKNSAGESSCTVSLRVKETVTPPEFVPISETWYEIDEGGEVTFTTKVKGRPEPKITWFKDGVRLRGDARLKTMRKGDEYVLTISRATTLDSGIYKCTASSPAGTASVEFELVVNGKCLVNTRCYQALVKLRQVDMTRRSLSLRLVLGQMQDYNLAS